MDRNKTPTELVIDEQARNIEARQGFIEEIICDFAHKYHDILPPEAIQTLLIVRLVNAPAVIPTLKGLNSENPVIVEMTRSCIEIATLVINGATPEQLESILTVGRS